MSTPNYFSKFPDLRYAVGVNKAGQGTFIKIKDFFKHAVVNTKQYPRDVIYYEYNVVNGMRPEQIAYREYGDEKYYYIVLQINDITDYYSQWPLSTYELERYIDKKYGVQGYANNVRHYETVETKNKDEFTVLEGGLVVSEDFEFPYRSSDNSNVILISKPGAVTYREHEYKINEEKSRIQLLNKSLVFKYETEMLDYVEQFRGTVNESDISVSDYLQ